MWQVFFGGRNPAEQVAGLKPLVNVQTAVEHLERRFSGVEATYHSLCEVAHPNGLGFLALHGFDDRLDAVFDLQMFAEEQLPDIVRAPRLEIAEECFAATERLAATVIQLGRKDQPALGLRGHLYVLCHRQFCQCGHHRALARPLH